MKGNNHKLCLIFHPDLLRLGPQKKIKPLFPSGLAKNWRTNVTVPGTTTSLSKASKKDKPSFPLGGLADSDVGAHRPATTDTFRPGNSVSILKFQCSIHH